ncbi:MAG: leucine-rich repeat protein [Oscillospiraceae bacterium]|nr:leucine-rich repeat protein [Oscillospiraceae bacterium]
MNRITAAVTALIMTAGMTFPAFAEEQAETLTASVPEGQEEKITESETDDGLSASCGVAAMWKYDPETKTLTVSGTGAAELSVYASNPGWKEKVETAVIENGVTGIGEGFFGGCKNLKSVSIPDSVICIDGAFYDCTSLKTITLPDSIDSLYQDTFAGCTALEEIHLGNQMQVLGYGISLGEFNGCTSLERINLPDSLRSITSGTFNGCTSLKEIAIPDHVESIDEGVFKDCTSLAEVTLGSGVYYIHTDAFGNCESLEKIVIPEKVRSIDEKAFAGCKKLKEVTVLSEECIIEDNSFEDCDPSLVIKAYKGSKAEKYAERNGFTFEAVQKKVPTEEERKEAERKQAEEEKEREEAALKREAEEKEQQKAKLIESLTNEGMRGDINGDGIINVFDVMRYKKKIINGNGIDPSGSTDINRDGAIDESDVSAVMNDALGKSVLWSYGTMPKMESSTVSANLESMFRAEMLGLKYSDAKKLVSDDDVSGQFKKLISGDTDIIFTDSVTEEQQKAASEARVKLNIVQAAKAGLVFIVNKSNPVDSLTSEQIKDIYSGKITNWKDVGGNDEVIVAFQRNDNSNSQRFIKKWMGERNLAEPLKIRDVNSEYKNLENAIGFACYSNAAQMGEDSSDIKYIAVDGVKPSAETMNDGTYPVLTGISAVYTDKASQKTRDFAAWALSAEGQKAVSDSGCIPVKKTEQSVKNKLYTAKGTGKEKPADLKPDWNGTNIFLYEKDGDQKLTWKDGMSKSECGLTCLKDKDVEEKINTDIRKVLFGDRDNLPGEWKMNVEVYNAYMNITFSKTGSAKETVDLIYDLRDGTKLEKFSDLFYKDTDFLPLLNRLLEREAAKNDRDIFATDFFGLSDDITQFDFNSITLGENNPYTAGVISLPLQDTWTRQLMGELVISEHFNSRDFFEEDFSYKQTVRLTEWDTNEWIEDYSYGSDGKLHYDFMSFRHTPDEIKERNRACDLVYEKLCDLYLKDFPDAAGKLRIDKNVFTENVDAQLIMSSVNAYRSYIAFEGSEYPRRYYCLDHDTLEPLSVSDVLGKNFEAYNNKYVIDMIDFEKGTVILNPFENNGEGHSWETLNISFDDLNMKYIAADDAKVTEFTRTKHGVVDSENALVYPESYIVKHDPQKKGEPVQKGFRVEIRKFTKFIGKTWYECWNAESGDYCGWIAEDNIAVQYTEDENKLKFTSFEETPIRGRILSASDRIIAQEQPQDVICYTNESVMDANSELNGSVVPLDNRYAEARNKCLSHGKWLYECWSGGKYIGWVEMHDFQMNELYVYEEEGSFPEKLTSERTGTVPGEKYNGLDFYSPIYIVSDTRINTSAGCVREDIKIRTDKRCLFHGEWWYECSQGGRYLGWINGDLIEFE